MRHLLFALLGALLIPISLHAGIVDREPIATPRSELMAAGYGRIVAGGNGLFLVHGQRITPEGVNLDGEPIPGTDGHAVAWHDGWMLIHPWLDETSLRQPEYYIRHLGSSGAPELVLRIPAIGVFVDAAADGRTIAILEQSWDTSPTTFWITSLDEHGIIQRRKLGFLQGGVIEPFSGGFVLATWIRSAYGVSQIHVWTLDADGTPRQFATIGEIPGLFPGIQLAVRQDHALLTAGAGDAMWMIDLSSLESRSVELPAGSTTGGATYPIATADGFFVSYSTLADHTTENRAYLITPEGTIVQDVIADRIVSADRIGDRFLVLRPWGDAGLAEDDPRTILVAIALKRRAWEQPMSIETVVSGEVTLVAWGYGQPVFVRFGPDGLPLDETPLALPPGRVVAIPHGFAFVSFAEGGILLQRLDLQDGWIDPEPHSIGSAADPLGYAAVGGESILVAWTTSEEMLWQRFKSDGTPIDQRPSHIPRTHVSDLYTAMSIGTNGGDHLILSQESYLCQISACSVPDLRFEVVAVGNDAQPIGPVREMDAGSPTPMAAGLADGTWVVPVGNFPYSILHLAHDGTPLDSWTNSILDGPIIDLEPTALGWRAVIEERLEPSRLVEVVGASTLSRVSGLDGIAAPRFAAGGRLAFLDSAPNLEGVPVAWSGRLEVTEGNLSVALVETPSGDSARKVQIVVRNEGGATATNVVVTPGHGITFAASNAGALRIDSLQPGEIRAFLATVQSYARPNTQVFVFSADIADVDPSDNVTNLAAAIGRPPRGRALSRTP